MSTRLHPDAVDALRAKKAAPNGDFTFYLGAHHADWLARAGVPLFVSRRTLARCKTLPRAVAPWACDSGGFSELSLHGRWTLSAREYAAEVRRYRDEIGQLAWAAPNDWMVEPEMLKRTGLSVEEHQRRTIDNFLELSALAPDLPWVPVLQGWTFGDYYEHLEAYARAGVDLRARPLVGIGTVCRRQHTIRISALLACLRADGLKLHGFGVKRQGLRDSARHLASADSMAWSTNARRNPHDRALTTCAHKSCANCLDFALAWREELLASIERAQRVERRAA